MFSSGSIFGNNSSYYSPFYPSFDAQILFGTNTSNTNQFGPYSGFSNMPEKRSPPSIRSKNTKIDGKHLVRCTALNYSNYCKK